MSKIKNEEMGKTLSNHPHIQIIKSVFGLKQTVLYQPTQSCIDMFQYDYTPEAGLKLERVFNAPSEKLEEMVKHTGKVSHTSVGNMHLDLCISRDHQFVAAQLFRYADLMFRPITDVKVYEGKEAEWLALLF